MSSKQSGCSRRTRSFMPRDSSWNTAVVRQDFSNAKVAASSIGSSAMSSGGPCSPAAVRAASMVRTAWSITVSVRRPRKSNFTRPAASTSSLSNCVTTEPPPASQ